MDIYFLFVVVGRKSGGLIESWDYRIQDKNIINNPIMVPQLYGPRPPDRKITIKDLQHCHRLRLFSNLSIFKFLLKYCKLVTLSSLKQPVNTIIIISN